MDSRRIECNIYISTVLELSRTSFIRMAVSVSVTSEVLWVLCKCPSVRKAALKAVRNQLQPVSYRSIRDQGLVLSGKKKIRNNFQRKLFLKYTYTYRFFEPLITYLKPQMSMVYTARWFVKDWQYNISKLLWHDDDACIGLNTVHLPRDLGPVSI